jgi:hypothetical protein
LTNETNPTGKIAKVAKTYQDKTLRALHALMQKVAIDRSTGPPIRNGSN